MQTPFYLAILLLPIFAFGQNSKLPTQFVDCVLDSKGQAIASRELRTPVFTSKNGDRAYGIVTATLKTGPVGNSCEYSSKIYLSKTMSEYQPIIEQGEEVVGDGSTFGGSGIQNLYWSPNGKYLMVEIFQWIEGADADANRTKYLLVGTDGTPPVVIHPDEKIYQSFKKTCAILVESAGWIDDSHFELLVKPFKNYDEEGEWDKMPACVPRDTPFSFEIATGRVVPLPSAKKAIAAKNLQR